MRHLILWVKDKEAIIFLESGKTLLIADMGDYVSIEVLKDFVIWKKEIKGYSYGENLAFTIETILRMFGVIKEEEKEKND